MCSGAFILAAAGLLDGRRATTRWDRAAELARVYPQVHVEPDPIFFRDGAIWTSAGVTAKINLALALVADDLGEGVAKRVAQQLVVYYRRPGGQSQFGPAPSGPPGQPVFTVLAWARERLADRLSVAAVGSCGYEPAPFRQSVRGRDRHDPSQGDRAAAA